MNFLDTVQEVLTFFTNSTPRWSLLALAERMAGTVKKKIREKLYPLRWEAKHKAIRCLHERYMDIEKALTAILLTGQKSEEGKGAEAFKNKIGIF